MRNNSASKYKIPQRRFGRTELNIPVLSLGGMRFQQSWNDIGPENISEDVQENLEKILQISLNCGMHHIETARHYGSSEMQLSWAIEKLIDPNRIIQTKVPPRLDPNEFEKELEISFRRLGCKHLDLLAIHGINTFEHLHQTLRKDGCIEVARKWQSKGLISHVGFSSHGSPDLIVQAIESNQFDYVNLHWYFIFQDNSVALDAAKNFDLGVFIISPTDKGGHLHSPSSKMLQLCSPLHPIVFNDLFCLSDPRVHTISVGASIPEDLDLHLQAVSLLDSSHEFLSIIEKRLNHAAVNSLGKPWLSSWSLGLPVWDQTPGGINLPVLLWLYNLKEAWGLEGYAKARYSLLGNGGHWFPGNNADCLDYEVKEKDLKSVLINSPWRDQIPDLLRELRRSIGGSNQKRLSSC